MVTGQILLLENNYISYKFVSFLSLYFERSVQFELSEMTLYNCTYPLQKFLVKTGEPGGARNRIITGGV